MSENKNARAKKKRKYLTCDQPKQLFLIKKIADVEFVIFSVYFCLLGYSSVSSNISRTSLINWRFVLTKYYSA